MASTVAARGNAHGRGQIWLTEWGYTDGVGTAFVRCPRRFRPHALPAISLGSTVARILSARSSTRSSIIR
jgi:hypothetical protein